MKGILSASMLVISCLNTVTVYAEPGYDDSDYWSAKCTSSTISDAEEYSACQAYREYMASQSEELNSQLQEIEAQRAEIAANIEKYSDQLSEYQTQVDSLNSEISTMTAAISENEQKIEDLQAETETTQAEIDECQAEVDTIAQKVLDRMTTAQWTMRLNTFLEILVGAKTFQDLIRIINGMSDITEYEQTTNKDLVASVEKLNDAKTKLEEEKKEMETAQAELQTQQDSLTEKRNEVLVAQYKVQVIEEAYESQAAAMEAQGNTYASDLSQLMSQISNLGDELDNIPDTVLNPTPEPTPTPTPTPTSEAETTAGDENSESEESSSESEDAGSSDSGESTYEKEEEDSGSSTNGSYMNSAGWVYPVPGAYRSAGTWAYSSGYPHLGYDFAASIGSYIYAVGNGIILFSADACDTYGYYGSTCGDPGSQGGGNQVYLLTKINGYLYAVKYLHMMSGTPIATGTVVSAGDVVGRVGTSGNSTGGHCHVEIFYLGDASEFADYARNWDGDLSFGAGWAGYGDRKCDAGYDAPCRIRPESIYGY